MPAAKVYVDVIARFAPDGKLTPLSITWEDGTEFEIDEITDICRAASRKAGGAGIRYAVRIGRTVTYLFREEDRWLLKGDNYGKAENSAKTPEAVLECEAYNSP